MSVIVCAYNGSSIIEQCLNGLVKQSFPPNQFEIIIIDDGSSDNTYEVVSSFITKNENHDTFIELNSIKHGGLSVARNSGIRISKSEIIAFIDQDAVPDTNWLMELIKPLQNGVDYVGGRVNLLNNQNWVARFLQELRFKQFFGPKLYYNTIIGCNMAFKRKIFDKLLGFHENFISYGDETTLIARIENKFSFKPAPKAIVFHQQPDNFKKLIQMEWKSATLSSLVKKASNRGSDLKEKLLSVEQFFITLFIPSFLLAVVEYNFAKGMLLLSSIFVVRRLFFRPTSRAIIINLSMRYGNIFGFTSFAMYALIENSIKFIGKLFSPIYHLNTTILPPMNSKLMVEKKISN